MRFISELARYSNSEVSGLRLQSTPGDMGFGVALYSLHPNTTIDRFEKRSLALRA